MASSVEAAARRSEAEAFGAAVSAAEASESAPAVSSFGEVAAVAFFRRRPVAGVAASPPLSCPSPPAPPLRPSFRAASSAAAEFMRVRTDVRRSCRPAASRSSRPRDISPRNRAASGARA